MKSDKLTVLYVHANNTDIGGADYCMFKLADELDKNRFKPIICLSERTEIVDLYEKSGIETHVIDMIRIKKNKNFIYLARLIVKFIPTVFTIKKIIKDNHVDIVQGNDLLDIYGSLAGKLSGVPTVQYIRWIIQSPAWLRLALTNIAHKLNTRVLTVSNGVASDMFFRDDRLMSHVTTCYDWIDMDKVGHTNNTSDIREEYKIDSKAIVIGNVGRLDPWKGQNIFIDAASKVQKKYPKTIFLIVGGEVGGDGRETYGDSLKEKVLDLGLEHNIIFTGQRSDISNIMRSIDIFVHSSVSPDPLPGVVMEAQFCEKPVVGADAGGVPEEIENNVTGLLYNIGDSEDMANKISYLLENKELSVQMGRLGKERVVSVFNKAILCEKIENIYEDLVPV